MLPRKTSVRAGQVTVSQTDTGRIDEYSKARESNLVKELGNLAPYLRYKGSSPGSDYIKAPERRSEWAQATV